ncbi:hypothetical protein B1756_13365 [Natrarchaeobaculum aegyptiacum]|uniref:Uncharacterized protein n=2 Tax=Natrarchaeobaculum aegyptiacum TaxID=745377 RepID=A0A2Z2HX95_9EURY|nr:hypothetical protein B1756_13365 [Natrarchaeobaculum aegyptiacum]
MGTWAWVTLFVVVPIVVLAATPVVGSRAAIAYVVVCACLWLVIWFSSPGFKYASYRLDPRSGTLRLTSEFDDPETSQFAAITGADEVEVDLERVDTVAFVTLPTHVVCQLEYRSLNLTNPEAIVVPRVRLREVADAFRTAGVSVPELTPGSTPRPRARAVGPVLRVFATPVLIGVAPLAVVQRHLGIDVWPILFGFAVLVVVVAARDVTNRIGVRPPGTRARDWVLRWAFDVILTAASLIAIAVAYVLIRSL